MFTVIANDTSTSPSVYVQFKGTAKMKDHCGTVGPILTKPTLAVQLSELKVFAHLNLS